MQLQLTAQLTGIEARNGGWFGISFMEQGAQYPKKLSTKRPELVQQAQQMMGQIVTALYNETESTNINPNNGQPYTNRFLEAISMPGQMPQPQQPQFVPQPQPQAQNFQAPQQQFVPQQQPIIQQAPQQVPNVRVSDDVRESRIMRQSAGKVAVDLLPLLDKEDQNLASLVRIAEQLVQYFRDGVQWQAPPVQNTAQAPQPQYVEGQTQYADPGPQQGDPYHAQGQAMPDDDIPFAPAIW